jgi:hypothetical protein
MSDLTDAYDAYTAKRKALWKIKRAELEAELHASTERKQFAREIYSARAYMTFDDIAVEIKNKNKNLLYKIIRDVVPVLVVDDKPIITPTTTWKITRISDTVVGVEFGDARENVTLALNQYGEVEHLPNEWYNPELTTAEERTMFRQIINEVEHGNG